MDGLAMGGVIDEMFHPSRPYEKHVQMKWVVLWLTARYSDRPRDEKSARSPSVHHAALERATRERYAVKREK